MNPGSKKQIELKKFGRNFDCLASPGVVPLLRASLDQKKWILQKKKKICFYDFFYDEKNDFLRMEGRKPGNLEWDDGSGNLAWDDGSG